jgi:hypothetical protein
MELRYVTLEQDPSLEPLLWSFADSWPAFMLHDPVSNLMDELPELYPGRQGMLLADDGTAVAKSHATGFVWDGTVEDLPTRGWDAVLERGIAATRAGRAPTAVSALEITVRPPLRGTGLSGRMLAEMRRAVGQLGLADLFAPVRPSAKAVVPATAMTDYIEQRTDEGLPADPWLRVHARAGGRIVKVAPCSMVIPGTLAQWRAWTGLPFDADGPAEVPGALSPVHVDLAQDHAVYVEANVWVHHRL